MKIFVNTKKKDTFLRCLVGVGEIPYPSIEQTFSGMNALHACFSKS